MHRPPPPPPSSPDDTDVTPEPDDRNDADYKPPKPQKHHRSTVYPWNHARNGCRAQSERNRAGGAGSSGSEPKQSDGVDETYERLLKCIHNCGILVTVNRTGNYRVE